MPIIYTGRGGPSVPPTTPEKEIASVTWTSPDGTETVLSGWRDGLILTAGAKGLGMPQYQLYMRESGALDGDVVTGVRAKARELFLPIAVYGEDRADALDKRAALARAFDPIEVNGGGEGVLTVTEPGSEPRSIRAYYSEGMEGAEGRDEAGWNWAKFGITLHAAEPYWSGEPSERFWGPKKADQTFLPVGPPEFLKVSNSQVIGTGMVIDCPGDARSYPRWTLKGPIGAGAEFANRTLGVRWKLNRALTAGDTVVVDCHPRKRTVLRGAENLWPQLEPTSQLWPLRPGRNVVDMLVPDVGATTSVRLEYVPLYKTAYPARRLTAATARPA
ncbi:phage distal tail protein [Spirillospora sp. NPDC050679]